MLGFQAADVIASTRGRLRTKPKTTVKKVTTASKVTTTVKTTTAAKVTTTAAKVTTTVAKVSSTVAKTTTAATTTAATTTAALPSDPGQVVEGGLAVSGSIVVVRQWGNVQVALTYDKVSFGGKAATTVRITGCTAAGPDHTTRSSFITGQAIPTLCQETLTAQSANIKLISGATDTSNGFIQSLQSALLQVSS